MIYSAEGKSHLMFFYFKKLTLNQALKKKLFSTLIVLCYRSSNLEQWLV